MRKVYLLMAAALIVMAGCKNNGSKKAKSAEEAETPVENVVNAMDEAINAIEADAEMDAKTALEKLSSVDASGLVETPEEMLKKNPNAAIPFSAVENKPTFNDSDANEFSKWVSEQVKYPQDAIDQNIQGKVVLQFTVNKEGQVEDVQVVRGVNEALDNEAVRVVSSSPKWEPGTQNGTPVKPTGHILPGRHAFPDFGRGNSDQGGLQQTNLIVGILSQKPGFCMAPVIAFAGEDGHAIFQQNPFMEAPAGEIGQIIGPYDKGELVLRFPFPKRVQRTDGVLGRGHLEFYILRHYLEFRMPGDGLQRCVVTVLAGRKAVGLFERVLRRYHQIYQIEAGFLGKKTDNGLMPFVQGVEAAAVHCYLHSGTNIWFFLTIFV